VVVSAQIVAGKPDTPPTIADFAVLLESHPAEGQPLSKFEEFQHVAGVRELAVGILHERAKARDWSNVVFALGAIGDQGAQDEIESFLLDPVDPLTGTSQLTSVTFEAKVDCIFAFGYMAVHSPDQRVRFEARKFLDAANATSAEVWRRVQWISPYQATPEARNKYLVSKVRVVMNALAGQIRASNGEGDRAVIANVKH